VLVTNRDHRHILTIAAAVPEFLSSPSPIKPLEGLPFCPWSSAIPISLVLSLLSAIRCKASPEFLRLAVDRDHPGVVEWSRRSALSSSSSMRSHVSRQRWNQVNFVIPFHRSSLELLIMCSYPSTIDLAKHHITFQVIQQNS
jgi:hypothetical protein